MKTKTLINKTDNPMITPESLNIHPELPTQKDVPIGIIGSGFIVNDCHLPAYRKVAFNPAGIASRNQQKAQQVANQHSIDTVYPSIDALLEDSSLQVLDIAVPPNAQLEIIEKACQKNIYEGFSHKSHLAWITLKQ
jgi:hypothetical protein